METSHRRIVIMRGVPGSGKTTYSKKLVDQGYNRVSKDDIREMINSYKLNNADEGIVHEIQEDTIRTLMIHGRNIVVDNTHAKQKYLDDLVSFVYKQGSFFTFDYEIVVETMDTPLEECLRRNSLRKKPVFEGVILKMHAEINDVKEVEVKKFMI